MESPLNITSEIGKLKTVLLHRPGEELENLTPDYLKELLFDDIPYLKQAQVEHDIFAKTLRDHGIETLYLEGLVSEALTLDNIRNQFIDEMLHSSKQGNAHITDALRKYLRDMDTGLMVRKVMAGVRKS